MDLSLSLFTSLAVVYLAISYFVSRFNLGVTKAKIVAIVRTSVQLLFLGYIIKYIFSIDRVSLQFLVMILMTVFAIFGSAFIKSRAKGLKFILFCSLVLSVWPATLITIGAVDHNLLFDIKFILPIFGMVMGNSLNGISLGIERFKSELEQNKELIQYYQYMGATKKEGILFAFQNAYRASITPILNTMNIAGLVSFPGLMTGQILAGRDPVLSAFYQVFIMFLISISIYLGSLSGIYLTYKLRFDDIIEN
ncbi:MAG: ABC transporter permease [Halobacteriovoraceae bacterium]|nr:ABC transporter permease [Halobacteriovoraceae bacterium]